MGKSLSQILATKTLGASMLHDLAKMHDKAELLLTKITETFPEYTEHNIKHSERIIEILSRILPEQLKEDLDQYEIYFLIAAAYFHDIGMVNFPELLTGVVLNETNNEAIAKYIRENHPLRSEQFVRKNFLNLAIDDDHQADIISKICLGHGKVDLNDEHLFESDRVYKSSSVNMPLLAALLRLGDSLDITFERAPLIIYNYLPIKSQVSAEEWRKHLSISGVVLQPEDTLTIKASAKCSSPNVHRLLKKIELEINYEIDNLPSFLHQYRSNRKDLPRRFVISIEPDGYKAFDFKFSLQENEITKLLMGEKLYQRKEESLREMLKNSVDACRARKESLSNCEFAYFPKIIFELTSERTLVIKDNGVGMDEDIVDRYFTKIGRSFYESQEFKEKFEFTPVSELGIGFLSSFMIADKVSIDTKKDTSEPLLIEIEDVSDYFLVQKGERKEIGTTIVLTLKKNIELPLLSREIEAYARHIEIPIEVKTPDQLQSIIVKDLGYELSIQSFYSKITDSDRMVDSILANYGIFYRSIHLPKLEGAIGILLRKNSKLNFEPIAFNYRNYIDRKLNSIVEAKENISISNEGIFVGHIAVLPIGLRLRTVFYDLNIKKKSIDLNAARNSIISSNEKYGCFIQEVQNNIFSLYRQFLTELRDKAEKAGLDFVKISKDFFENYMNLQYLREVSQKSKSPLPKIFFELFRDFAYLKCFTKEGVKYVNVSVLLEDNRLKRVLLGLDHYSIKHAEQIFVNCTAFESNYIYLSNESPYYDKINALLFPETHVVDFISKIRIYRSGELSELIPNSWIFARFNNYKTTRVIEISHEQTTILNKDNKFLDLLARNNLVFGGSKKMAVSGFFRTLKHDVRNNFRLVQVKQMEILKLLVEAGKISENEMINYLVTKDDFPPHMVS